jgi:regulator of sirC expression with transglutaminase-like and TPR domain
LPPVFNSEIKSGRFTLLAALTVEPKITLPRELARAFEAYHALVFRTAYRITGNAADAEDVLQTIFLRLLRRPERDLIENEDSYLRPSTLFGHAVKTRRTSTNRLLRAPMSLMPGNCERLYVMPSAA